MQLKSFKFTLFVSFLILILSGLPGDKMPSFSFKSFDKWGHFLAYLTMTLVFLAEFAKHLRWSTKTGRWLIAVLSICVGYGVLLEVLQGLIFYKRTFDFVDMAANTIGVGLGFLVYLLFFNTLKRYERFM